MAKQATSSLWTQANLNKRESNVKVGAACILRVDESEPARVRFYLVSLKSPTYMLKSEISDIFCQTALAY